MTEISNIISVYFFNMYNVINKLASSILNDIYGGLQGFHINISLSLEQLEQEIVDERLSLLKEYSLKGILPLNDLYTTIDCIEVDCKAPSKCENCGPLDPVPHFEIPQLLNDYGSKAIKYIGSIDKQNPFVYYTDRMSVSQHKYRKRGKNRPYVWIDTTPNEHGKYDCYIFNAPLIKCVTVVAIFKDLRQLEGCGEEIDNYTFLDTEIRNRIIEKKINYYRKLAQAMTPNTQQYS